MAQVDKIPMGIGLLGSGNAVFKRKFRFTFQIQQICPNLTMREFYVKSAGRPKLTIEDTQIDFLNARTWIPGKAHWETINVVYYDVASFEMQPIYEWMANVYEFTDPINLRQGSRRSDYSAVGILRLYDGCGQLLEVWTLKNMFPTTMDFGELDYGSSDFVTIALTLRYSEVEFHHICPGFTPDACCTPCGSGSSPSSSGPFV